MPTTTNAARRDPEQIASFSFTTEAGPDVQPDGYERLCRQQSRLRSKLGASPKPERLPAVGQCVALVEVARGLREPFTLVELTLAAWKKYPELFGLRGHERAYPSDHRVSGCLFGASGPRRRGLMRKEGRGYVVVRQAGEE